MNPVDGADITSNTSLSLRQKTVRKANTLKIMGLSKEVLEVQRNNSKVISSLEIPKEINSIATFWNILERMDEITLKEQLQDLLLLYDLKNSKENFNTSYSLLAFSFYLVKEKNSLGISKLRTIIGKLIYLVNKDLVKISLGLREKDEIGKIRYIESAFDNELQNIGCALSKFSLNHLNGMVQNEQKALSVRIPIEIAKALVSDTGYINIGIIDPLLNAFLCKTKNLPFAKNIVFALNNIKRSSSLRQKLHLIPAPFSQTLPANDLIRITLSLEANAITTHIDAKKTALAALISHMRQGPAGSCFASYLAIELLSKQLSRCLDDFCDLLHKNNISRLVGDEQKEFSFLMRTGKESTSKIISLDKYGKVYSEDAKSCYIWKIPGIVAACQAIGLTDSKKTLQTLSLELSLKMNKDLNRITISKLLKMIAQQVGIKSDYSFQCAKLGFESQLHNPLLRIWENVIASMAEATEHGKITDGMIHSVRLAFKKILSNLHLKREVGKKIKENLKNSAHFAYDSDIKSHSISNDGRSARGAFILYNRCGSSDRSLWKHIESPDDFRTYISSIVFNSFTSLKNRELFFPQIKEFIINGSFLTECLSTYHIDNSQYSDAELIQKIKTLAHTPWKDKAGSSSNEVLRIYFESPEYPIPTILNPKNAATLFLDLIEIGRKFSDKMKQSFRENPSNLTPLIIKGIHACSMMFGHESLALAINSNSTSIEWITEKLINPGKIISNSKITESARLKLIRLVTNNTIPKNDTEGLEKFNLKIQAIPPNSTIKEFRNTLVTIIKEISKENYYPLKTIAQGIDFFIFKYVISEEDQNKIITSSIHFADSNWDAKLHDVHFCFMFNPGNGHLEMWEIYEDNTGAYPLSQEDWITKQTWMIYNP